MCRNLKHIGSVVQCFFGQIVNSVKTNNLPIIIQRDYYQGMDMLEEMDTEEKWVDLVISEKKDHLLLKIENPIRKPPRFVDGVPTSGKKGHGIGVKSIVYYVEQLNGQCHFSVNDHSFVLRIII